MKRLTPTATSGTHRIYIDNVLKTTVELFFPLVATTANNIGRGAWYSGGLSNTLQGKVDSFSIYPWALSPSEVVLLFGATGNKVTYHTNHYLGFLQKVAAVASASN